MELPFAPHHMIVKKATTLLFVLFFGIMLHAQRPEYHISQDVQYDYQTRLYKLRSTNNLYTGYVYTLNYYTKDTSMLQYYSSGKMDWSKTFGEKKRLIQSTVYYTHGLKNDSICMEQISFTQNTGDTTAYFVQYIDKKKAKWQLQRSYYYNDPNKKPALWMVRYQRFFTRTETKNFVDRNYQLDQNYDSLGYYNSSAETGMFTEYFDNGKLKVQGRCSSYEFCMSHRGSYPSYPSTGRSGVWTYYSYVDGSKNREEVYDTYGRQTESRSFYPSGKLEGKYNYKKRFSDFRLPSPQGITVGYYDSCVVVQTKWYENGNLLSEQFTTPTGDIIVYSFYPNGKPTSFTAHTSQRKAFGIHRKWDEAGKTTSFVNYSVEWNDTICYAAQNGQVLSVNLRKRQVPIDWKLMPYDYYGSGQLAVTYLNNLIAIHREYYQNGQMKLEANLEKGKRNGAYTEYSESGVQVLKVNFKNEIPDGGWTEWYPNGKVKKDFQYRDGIRTGTCTEYYSSGTVKWENSYINGVPGTPQAFSENGTKLNGNYLTAFNSATCIAQQSRAVGITALHYYFLDTSASKTFVTLPDTAVNRYALKIVAAFSAITPGYDLCAQVSGGESDGEFDAYHSCFAISASLFNDSNKRVMRAFFERNGIHQDSTGVSRNPILGLEKEYLVYYSSKQILNKPLIMDSLEQYIARNSGDGKNGYLISIDSNQPAGSVIGGGRSSTMSSTKGYTTIIVSTGTPQYPQYNSKRYYIVYDDLACDFQKAEEGTDQLRYWPAGVR